jgi:hypothetical protein
MFTNNKTFPISYGIQPKRNFQAFFYDFQRRRKIDFCTNRVWRGKSALILLTFSDTLRLLSLGFTISRERRFGAVKSEVKLIKRAGDTSLVFTFEFDLRCDLGFGMILGLLSGRQRSSADWI